MTDYVLVPREVMEAMLDAAADYQEADPADGYASELYYAYTAMLAARPPVDYDALAHALGIAGAKYIDAHPEADMLEVMAMALRQVMP